MISFSTVSFGQTPPVGPQNPVVTSTTPSGSCSAGAPLYQVLNVGLYQCVGGTWTAVGSGSGTITGVTAGTGLSGGGTSGAVTITGTVPCVGTPGNTTANYRQPCQAASGAVYACNNSAGCLVAADWAGSGSTIITTAVQGTLSSNVLRDRPSVGDTAADPTGNNDSTTAIETLITAQSATYGSTIYIPCGTYKLTSTAGNAALSFTNPTLSFEGAGLGCVTFNYVGAGRAIDFFPAGGQFVLSGTLGGFNLVGTSAAQVGIKTGATSSTKIHDLVVQQFTAGDGIQMLDGSAANNWIERNLYENLQVNYNLVGIHMIKTGTAPSFGYNDFIGIRATADIGQTAFLVDAGAFVYNGQIDITCNLSNSYSATGNVICVGVKGNVSVGETVKIGGETDNTGSGTATYYSAYTYAGGQLLSNSMAPQISGATVYNANAASYVASNRFAPTYEASDTGTFTLNSVSTTPAPYSQSATGLCGELVGTNINSPFCTMYNYSGNAFVIGAQPYGSPIGSMTQVASIDTSGNVLANGAYSSGGYTLGKTVSGSVTAGTLYELMQGSRLSGLFEVKMNYASGSCYALLTVQGSQYSNGIINILSNSCYSGSNGAFAVYQTSGGANIVLAYTAPQTGTVIVTNYGIDAGNVQLAACGANCNTNVTYFQNSMSSAGFSTAATTQYGIVATRTSTASNTDMGGELSFSAATTASYTFAGTYTSHPECWSQAQGSTATSGSPYITYTGSTSMTINFPVAFTGNVSYGCIGRN